MELDVKIPNTLVELIVIHFTNKNHWRENYE
jgi:hypothetical protein